MNWIKWGEAAGVGINHVRDQYRIKQALDPRWYQPVGPPLPVERCANCEGVFYFGLPRGWRDLTSEDLRRVAPSVMGHVALGVCTTEPDPRLGCSATSFVVSHRGPQSPPWEEARMMFVEVDEMVRARVQGLPDMASYGAPARIGLDGERAFVHHMIGSAPGDGFGVEQRVAMTASDVFTVHAATLYVGMFASPTETYDSYLPHLWTMLGNWHWHPQPAVSPPPSYGTPTATSKGPSA